MEFEINNRIIQLINYLGITQNAFAKRIGASSSRMSNITTHRNRPDSELLKTILTEFRNVSADWLVTGAGEMIKNNSNVHLNVHPNVHLNEKNNQNTNKDAHLSAHPNAPLNKKSELKILPIAVDKAGKELIPLVPIKAQAGYLNNYQNTSYFETLPCYALPGFNNGTFRMFEVEGHSMYRTLHEGDIIVAQYEECCDDIRNDRVYVVVTERDGLLVKRILNRIKYSNKLILKSDNSNLDLYPDIIIEPSEVRELWYVKGFISRNLAPPSDIYEKLNNLEGEIIEIKDILNKK